jgi:hypothetical protein
VIGLALAATSAVPWAAIVTRLAGHSGPTRVTRAELVFTLVVSLTGLFLGVFAVWSAIKAWLRQDVLTPRARLGLGLGLATMAVVVAVGPCGSHGCPG